MKTTLIKALLLLTLAFQWASVRAEDKTVSYEPTVATLSGTIVEEGYGDDSSPINRGKHAWILRLDRIISLPATPGDDINIEEKNVTEVHLNLDRTKHRIDKNAFGRTAFTANGTIYHRHNGNHLRPIVMLVSDLKAASMKNEHD